MLASLRLSVFAALAAAAPATIAESAIPRDKAIEALRKATAFFREHAATEGGYAWVYGGDALQYRMGEGLAYDRRIWIQPPGTPAVGMAMLDAYEATGDRIHLEGAIAAAHALVKGQLHSGGWPYSVTFDPAKRRETNYRVAPTKGDPGVRVDPADPGGWDVWKQRKYKSNITLVDDDTTPAALRLLMRVDKALGGSEKSIRESAEFGLASLLKTQHPVGAWSHNFDHFPKANPSADYYPVLSATIPDDWPRKWPKAYAGCYVINDRITLNVIETMLLAHEIYGRKKYLDSAALGGEFLIRAQLPEPQPAWAQQYDRAMQPVWDRPFEPPAITGLESQDAIETLFLLYRKTGDKKFLAPVAKALPYLKKLTLGDGNLARFYELKTDRPLFFTKDYQITYDRGETPSHYGFVFESRLDALTKHYESLARLGAKAPDPTAPTPDEIVAAAEKALRTQDPRGLWTEPGFVRDREGKKVTPPEGVVRSETFIKNVEAFSRFLALSR